MKRSNKALRFIYLIALIAVVSIVINVFLVTLGKYHFRSGTSLKNYISSLSTITETIHADRGNIYDINGEIIAQDQKTYDIICYLSKSRVGNGKTPAYVDDPLYTSQVLSSFLNIEQSQIFEFLTAHPNWYQTELGNGGRNLSYETVEAILSYPNIHGIGFRESSKRVYLQGSTIAPYLVGYAQYDNETGDVIGKMGLERNLNDYLNGENGLHTYQMDKNGYVLPGMYEEYVAEKDGYDVYLTLDSSIQEALETSFDNIVTVNNAKEAWGGVVEVNTGKILAWGQTPSFDPNTLDINTWLNYGSQYPYEPGSVFKPVIYAAAMDLGVYNGTEKYNSDTYCYHSRGNTPYRVYDSRAYGCITNAAGKTWGSISFDTGLIYSSNVATMTLLEEKVGTQNFIDYVYKFGFFQNVDTDGIEEAETVKNYIYPSEKLSLTYGQGSSVTMLQLFQAYTAIFGNGEMLKPYFIDKVVDPETNEVVYQGERTVVGTPIKESTARQLQSLITRVVTDPGGTAKYYGVDEVQIMAKTGTSEISLIGEGYNSEDSISSIMLAFPADNPQYMIYYAYVSPYNYYNHLNSSVIKELIRKVAVLTKMSNGVSVNNSVSTYEKVTMPNLLNMNVNEAVDLMLPNSSQVITIGDGKQVVGQYPEANSDYYSSSKVFLLTEGNTISLPDFKGWTRKDVVTYWNLSGLMITLDGYGVVYEQNRMPYSIVTRNDEVELKLYDINTESIENIADNYTE